MAGKCWVCGHVGIFVKDGVCVECRTVDTINSVKEKMGSPEKIKVVLSRIEKGFVKIRIEAVQNEPKESGIDIS